jgi:dTDP-4-dehydrorhamnose reductase
MLKIPTNFYADSKKIAEQMVMENCEPYLIIRTSFIRNPFPHEKAFTDQYTTGDYVDVIAPMILEAMIDGREGILDIGTYRKTMYELALRTKPEVGQISVDDIKGVVLPKDYETIKR